MFPKRSTPGVCPSCGERQTSLIAGCALCGDGRDRRPHLDRGSTRTPSELRPRALSRLAWRLVHRA